MLCVLWSHLCFSRVGGRHCLCRLVVPDPRRLRVCHEPHARQGEVALPNLSRNEDVAISAGTRGPFLENESPH